MTDRFLTRRSFNLAALGGAASALVAPRLTLAATGENEYDLVARTVSKVLYRPGNTPSELWGYNGEVPGPEIRARKGDRIRVRFRNELSEPTSIHWHGIRIENAMDGVAGMTQDPVAPGDSFVYEFDLPDAGSYWYHAHNKSWNQVGRGLYGALIVDEADPVYDRDHDMTLILDDWRLREPGVLETDSFGSLMDWSHAGRLGNWITVNGESLPTYTLNRGEAYRLRLINTSNARIFALDPSRFDAQIIAYDGQALPEAQRADTTPMLLGPAQRVDLVVQGEDNFVVEDVTREEPIVMVGFAVTGDTLVVADAPVAMPAMNMIAEPDLANARHVEIVMEGGAMGNLGDITYQGRKLEGNDFRETRQVWAFNGVANLGDEPVFSARRGETIIIETVNASRWTHAMHVHGHHFRVLANDGYAHGPWRDTYLISPQQKVQIAFVSDNPGKWLYHCHMLEHAAAGMNSWFKVD